MTLEELEGLKPGELLKTARNYGCGFKVGTEKQVIIDAILAKIEEGAEPNVPQRSGAVPVPDVRADTIAEARFLPEDEQFDNLYKSYFASDDLVYVMVNPKPRIADRRNPCDVNFYLQEGYRKCDVQVPEGMFLKLIYREGHPEHPRGAESHMPPGKVLMAIPRLEHERKNRRRSRHDNPGLTPETQIRDVEMKAGQYLTMVLDKKGFKPGHADDIMATPAELAAHERRIERGAEKMRQLGQETGVDLEEAITRAAEAALVE